jgi:(p)ppGpp synthase/HD superfamily hydrolase
MAMSDSDSLSPPTGARLDLLKRLGFGELTHDSHVPFLSHLVGTRRLLVEWGERPAMCDAGLFHSAYGTEYFPVDQDVERSEVQAVIGREAEEIAHAWCTIRRDTIDVGPPSTVEDRTTGDRVEFSEQLIADIATLWAADTVEQIHRMDDDERAFAVNLSRVLHLARPVAQEAVRAKLAELGTS